MDVSLAALIDDICAPEPARVAAALQAAAPHRETLAPVLVARLMQAAAEPRRWTGARGQPSPVFLCYLAAAWKLTAVHPLVVALLRLPPDDCDAVLGDFITEGARLVLADTWPGDLRAIEALALDERAEPFARGAALGAAALLAARGAIPRETALALLSRGAALSLHPGDQAHCNFAGQIVSTALALHAWELRGTISGLFARELVDPFFCGDLDQVLAELPEGTPFVANERLFPPPIDDAWDEVSSWHFFDELFPTRRHRARRTPPSLPPPPPAMPETSAFGLDPIEPATFRRDTPKVGRNDPSPCGSGKKHKKCCGG